VAGLEALLGAVDGVQRSTPYAGGAARYEKFEVQTTAIFTVKFHAK